jgi:hypothetical protein
MPEALVWGVGVVESGVCEFPDCFPDASSTGVPAGTSLTAYSGPTDITVDGTVIDGKIVSSDLTINANNVIIRKSQITLATTGFLILVQSGSLLIEDCELSCSGQQGTCIGSENFTMRRCDLTSAENGVDVGGVGNVLMEDNYFHDLISGGGAHTDGIQLGQGADDISILHNTILDVPGGNSCIIMWDGGDPQGANVLVEHNRLVGVGGYTIYTPRDPPLTNVKVINNRLGEGATGYNGGDGSILTDRSGNIDDVTGLPVDIS